MCLQLCRLVSVKGIHHFRSCVRNRPIEKEQARLHRVIEEVLTQHSYRKQERQSKAAAIAYGTDQDLKQKLLQRDSEL